MREAVDLLARRVDALELAVRVPAGEPAGSGIPDSPVSPPIPLAPSEAAARGARVDVGWLATVGRTFMVLGGAYLLRALTESHKLSVPSGIWLGLTYASVWLLLAYRARGLSTQLHGLAALLVGMPLIVEAALHFGYFSAAAGAAALAALGMATLAVAWHRRCRILAGLAAASTIAAAFTLAFGFGAFVAFSLVVILAGIASLWIDYQRGWSWLRWPTAFTSNLAVLLLAARALAVPPRENPLAAQAVHGVLIAAYVGTFIIRTLLHDRPVLLFEMIQTAGVLTIGLSGAVAIAHAGGIGVEAIALGALLAGGVMYAQTFARIATRFGLGTEFYYFGTTALALTLVGLSLSFPFPARPVIVALAALGAIAIGWRWGHPMLTLQGGIAAVVASGQSGLIAFSARSWLTFDPVWPAHLLPMIFVLATVAAALIIPRAVRDPESTVLAAIARVGLSLALVAGVGSLIVAALAPIVAGQPIDHGALATMRTIILAASAIVLALIGRAPRFVEMRWIGFAVLAAGAAKILFEDFPVSRPATLFIALAVYGAALIAVQRIVRSRPLPDSRV